MRIWDLTRIPSVIRRKREKLPLKFPLIEREENQLNCYSESKGNVAMQHLVPFPHRPKQAAEPVGFALG